jgi:hypothetical protein
MFSNVTLILIAWAVGSVVVSLIVGKCIKEMS